MILVHWFPGHIFSVLVRWTFSCRRPNREVNPKSWLQRFKNDKLAPLRLLYPSLQSWEKTRNALQPLRETVAAVHKSPTEPTSRWSLQNSKPMSPRTLLTFFLAFRRLPRLLTGSWNILPTWVKKDKHIDLSTGIGTTGLERLIDDRVRKWSNLGVMRIDERSWRCALILVHSIVIL